jgi:hypothetical protein
LLKVSGEVYIFAFGLLAFALLEFINYLIIKAKKYKNGFSEVLVDLNNMPKTMKQLAVVQFFSWFALFAMWIYTTPAITEHIFNSTDPPLLHTTMVQTGWSKLCCFIRELLLFCILAMWFAKRDK